MKEITFTKQDILVLLIIVFPYLVVVSYLLMGQEYFGFPKFIWATITASVIGVCFWAMHIIAAILLRYYIPGYWQSLKRLMIQFPVYMFLTLLLGLTLFSTFQLFGFTDYSLSWNSFRGVFFSGLLLNVAATGFHEGLYAFEKWKNSLLETEQLKKNFLQSQLEGLKSQVNPHFLFNSLNCLSALINSDQQKAEKFVDEMSKVYRYLLKSNEHELISLEAELQFTHSFFHMLKTRYDNGIELDINIYKIHLDYLLPPLTLQMLLENAVKHNIIQENYPLRISISSQEQDILIVSNNIQKKTSKIASNKVGLQNIITKYKLINQSEILILDDGKSFTIKIPLIKNIYDESIDYRG